MWRLILPNSHPARFQKKLTELTRALFIKKIISVSITVITRLWSVINMGVSEFSGSSPGKLLTHLSKGCIDDQHVTYQTFLWVVEATTLRSSMPREKQQAPVKHDKQPLCFNKELGYEKTPDSRIPNVCNNHMHCALGWGCEYTSFSVLLGGKINTLTFQMRKLKPKKIRELTQCHILFCLPQSNSNSLLASKSQIALG